MHVKARLHYSLRNTAEAVQVWQQCAERDPNNPEVYLGLGAVAKETGDYRHAEEMFRKTLALAPGNAAATIALAETLTKQGQLREVVELLREYLKNHSISSPVADCLGQACLQLEDYPGARQSLTEGVRLQPQNRSAWYGLARTFAALGDRERQRECLAKSQELAARDGDAPTETESADEAAMLSDLPLVRRLVVQTQLDTAGVYVARGRMEQAERLWRRVAALDPRNRACRAELGLWYERTGREREALQMCEQLRDLEPDNADHWRDVGVLNARLGRYDVALAAVAKAIHMEPGNPQYRQAYELIQKGQ